MSPAARLRRIRRWLALFIVGLALSGVTAFPLQHELDLLVRLVGPPGSGTLDPLQRWIAFVHDGLHDTYAKYPFVAYGTDWLAFAHLILAVLFVGPYRDPVRNKFVVDFGLFACVAILPLALIAGPIRGIPFGWRLIDCSFGLFGAVPLLFVRREINAMCGGERLSLESAG
jgi:hypothetical protein